MQRGAFNGRGDRAVQVCLMHLPDGVAYGQPDGSGHTADGGGAMGRAALVTSPRINQVA